MAEYKKRRVDHFKRPPRPKRIKHTEPVLEEIPMSEERKKEKKKPSPTQKMRVIKGKKTERKRRLHGMALAAGILIFSIVLAHIILPCGILENIRNGLTLIGTGGYPIELESTDTIQAVSGGSYYYALTNNELIAFSNSGKKIYSVAHGFENPILKTSATRALLFSQSGHELSVRTLFEQVGQLKTEESIITADIADSGVYAVAIRSPGYAATVQVYDKDNKLLYEWNSAVEMINTIAVSPNGKKIAVAAFQSVGGAYQTKLQILNFKSATPEFEKTLSGEALYELSAFSKGFFAVGKNRVDFYEWSGGRNTEYSNEYDLSFFKKGRGEAAAVFTRASDKTDTKMVIFSKKGEKKSEFEFRGAVSDIQIANGHIYCISDNQVSLIDGTGAIIRSAQCKFGARKIAPINMNFAAVFSDQEIEKVKLEQQGEEQNAIPD